MKSAKSLWFALLSVAAVAGLQSHCPWQGSIESTVLMGARWWAIGALAHLWVSQEHPYYLLCEHGVSVWQWGTDFPAIGSNMEILSKIFIQLIKTVIAPLLFGTLVVGIAGTQIPNK